MIRVKDVKISITSKDHDIKKAVARKLGIMPEEIREFRVHKKSIDARKKDNIIFTYTIDADVKNVSEFKDMIIEEKDNYPVINKKRKSDKRPVVIGAGPAGLFAAYIFAKEGLNPIVIEQGKTVDERKKDVDKFWSEGKLNTASNVQFGEGGAGTFSDGKLTTLINNPNCDFVLKTFTECGAPEEILYEAKPHVGTDKLIETIRNLRENIKALGGEFYFDEKVVDFDIENNKIKKVKCKSGLEFETDTVILAIGHSARYTFEMILEKKFDMIPKAFSVGVRIEHLQSEIDKVQYGSYAGHKLLGPSEYKMAYHGNRSCYTFCMCPGGLVVASASEDGRVVTNGMSNYKRDGVNANCALLVNVTPEDFEGNDVLRGMHFQRKLEEAAYKEGGANFNAPVQRAEDFIAGRVSEALGDVKPSYKPGYKFADFNNIFPTYISDTMKEALNYMEKRIKGFKTNGLLTGVETRSSSPVRIVRSENLMSNIEGVYPCGEGAGYAGGIMSAAVDGIRCAVAAVENE